MAIRSEKRNLIFIHMETGFRRGYIIGYQQIQILSDQFFPAMSYYIIGFCGKANQYLILLSTAEDTYSISAPSG